MTTSEPKQRRKAPALAIDEILFNLIKKRGVFWSYLIPRISRREDRSIDTMAVTIVDDQIYFLYNPEFVARIDNTIAECLHEFYHIVLRHLTRMHGNCRKHPEIAEMAAECACNSFLLDEKFSAVNPIYPSHFRLPNHETYEWYYHKLYEKTSKLSEKLFGRNILEDDDGGKSSASDNSKKDDSAPAKDKESNESKKSSKDKKPTGDGKSKTPSENKSGQGEKQPSSSPAKNGKKSKSGDGKDAIEPASTSKSKSSASGKKKSSRSSGTGTTSSANGNDSSSGTSGAGKGGQAGAQKTPSDHPTPGEQTLLDILLKSLLGNKTLFDNYKKTAPNDSGNQELVKSTMQGVISRAEAAMKSRGITPGEDFYAIKKIYSREVKWTTIIRRHVGQVLGGEYYPSWSKIDKRMDDYPGKKESLLPRLFVGIDTSGSISQKDLNVFAAEINHLRNIYDSEYVQVIDFDAEVHRVYKLRRRITTVTGRGGTCFTPCIKLAEKRHANLLIILTDGYGESNVYEPKRMKVVWLVKDNDRVPATFGKAIRFKC